MYSLHTNLDNRINWIDWGKAICIYLVIIGHCHINEGQSDIMMFFNSFRMPLFFFLSGWLNMNSLSWSAIKKNARFLLIPYITFGLVFMIFNAVASHNALYLDFYFAYIFVLLKGLDTNIGPIWFLPALFFCKLCFWLIQSTKHFSKPLFYLLSITTIFPIYFICKYKINMPMFADSGICALPFFIAGNLCSRWDSKTLQRNRIFLLVICAALCVSLWYLTLQNKGIDISNCSYGRNLLLFYLNATLGITLILMICKYFLDTIHSKLISIIAYGTIIILGLHGLFIRILDYYIPQFLWGKEIIPYPIEVALVISFISLFLCTLLIPVCDTFCPKLVGLKGNKVFFSKKP